LRQNGTVIRRLLSTLGVLACVAVPAAQGATSVTYVFTSYTTVTKTHDTPPKGKANAGDKIEFKDLLVTTKSTLGKQKGKPVGYDAGTVVYTSAKTQTIQGVTTIPGVGTLTFAGPMITRKDGTVRIPVVNGTGSFKGAKGMLIIGEGTEKAPNTYVLKLPHAVAPPGSA
jgi:hypothetical protein